MISFSLNELILTDLSKMNRQIDLKCERDQHALIFMNIMDLK